MFIWMLRFLGIVRHVCCSKALLIGDSNQCLWWSLDCVLSASKFWVCVFWLFFHSEADCTWSLLVLALWCDWRKLGCSCVSFLSSPFNFEGQILVFSVFNRLMMTSDKLIFSVWCWQEWIPAAEVKGGLIHNFKRPKSYVRLDGLHHDVFVEIEIGLIGVVSFSKVRFGFSLLFENRKIHFFNPFIRPRNLWRIITIDPHNMVELTKPIGLKKLLLLRAGECHWLLVTTKLWLHLIFRFIRLLLRLLQHCGVGLLKGVVECLLELLPLSHPFPLDLFRRLSFHERGDLLVQHPLHVLVAERIRLDSLITKLLP